MNAFFPENEIHDRPYAEAAGGPRLTPVVFHDLFDDGKPYAASPFRRISRSVRPVKPVKNKSDIPGSDALPVIFHLDLDKIPHIPDAQLDHLGRLIHIFDGIAHDIVDHPADLLAIRNHPDIIIHIIGIQKFYAGILHLKP